MGFFAIDCPAKVFSPTLHPNEELLAPSWNTLNTRSYAALSTSGATAPSSINPIKPRIEIEKVVITNCLKPSSVAVRITPKKAQAQSARPKLTRSANPMRVSNINTPKVYGSERRLLVIQPIKVNKLNSTNSLAGMVARVTALSTLPSVSSCSTRAPKEIPVAY